MNNFKKMICKSCPPLLYRSGIIFAFLEPEDNQILYAERNGQNVYFLSYLSSQCHLLSSSMASEVGLQEDRVNKDFLHTSRRLLSITIFLFLSNKTDKNVYYRLQLQK